MHLRRHEIEHGVAFVGLEVLQAAVELGRALGQHTGGGEQPVAGDHGSAVAGFAAVAPCSGLGWWCCGSGTRHRRRCVLGGHCRQAAGAGDRTLFEVVHVQFPLLHSRRGAHRQ